MNRRLFLKTIFTGGTISTATVGVLWFSIDTETEPLTINNTLAKLAKFRQQLIDNPDRSLVSELLKLD